MGGFGNRDIISITDLSKDEIILILSLAERFEKYPQPHLLEGKLLATLFFEPSTRTRLSFTSAMQRLGGKVLGFDNTEATSLQKGESLHDTIKMVENYADAIVIRHPLAGSGQIAANASRIPLINAGDGSNQHPTQTLIDLYTIQKEKGTLDGLHIAFVGDLKYGRTVHSLCNALIHFNVKISFVAPPDLQIHQKYLDEFTKRNIQFTLTADLVHGIQNADIIYMTRIQKERFPTETEYLKYKDVYQLNLSVLKHARRDVRILHPLPRINEISTEIDATPNAAYFRQAASGIPVRQALLALVLGAIDHA